MICPKCKKQISEKLLKCDSCGTKIASFCKKCNAYNPIYNLNCEQCKTPLLKICPVCKSVNFPEALKCRKCENVFEKEIIKEPIAPVTDEKMGTSIQQPAAIQEDVSVGTEQPVEIFEQQEPIEEPVQKTTFEYVGEMYSQQKAKELIIKGISSGKRVMSLSGVKGIGKSIVLKSILNEMQNQDMMWLIGECSSITQLSPCGLIQDILLTFFNVANYCADSLKLKKDSQKFFQNEFPTLTNEEIFNLLNLLYPANSDYFENILKNKEKTFTLLHKVFKTIIENKKTVFIIDNFDFIDGFSYEFLHNLLNIDFVNKPLFIITYSDIRPARGYLYCSKLNDDAYLDVCLGNFDRSQMNAFVEQYFVEEKCPEPVKNELFSHAAGNPAVLEQFATLLWEFKYTNNSFDIQFPKTFTDVVIERLNSLKQDQASYQFLEIAAIQGNKFSPFIIGQILNMEENTLIEIMNSLQSLNFIMPVSELTYAFKNSMLWIAVLEIIKEDTNFAALNEKLFVAYSNYILSSNSIRAIIAQNLNQDLTSLNIWTDNIKLSAYMGDTNLYAISQKQCLNLIEKVEGINKQLIKNNIYERLGKLLSNSNPKEAIEYLPDVIISAKNAGDVIKEIELTSYLASCCITLGDYYGTIECVDSVINKIDSSLDLEAAMLKARKVNALLNIGNSGEIINLIDNEIMPVFDRYISAKPHKNISLKSLYKAWLQAYLDLTNALVFQGNSRAFEVIGTMFELFQKNNLDEKLFICKTKLALAFANTIKGDIEASEEILGEVIKTYRTDIMDNEAISRWNLINILNNFILKKYTGMQEELFQVVTFANNINDHFTKNVLKTMLGKLFKDEDSAKRALDIYSEQITYFAKEKNAIGALLTWYFIAEANLIAEGPESSLEISQKALEVAQSPKINNYLFMVLYNKVIAEAFMAQADYESAKIHIEQGIMIAKKFELFTFLADLYLLYGKYLQDIAIANAKAQKDYVVGASKMYKKAMMIAKGIKNSYIVGQIDKAKTVLNSFCQLNGITLVE